MVACWIGAYWFTASTSFANRAITIARSLSNAFSGTRPADVTAFTGAQFVGAFAALPIARALFPLDKPLRAASDAERVVGRTVREKAEALNIYSRAYALGQVVGTSICQSASGVPGEPLAVRVLPFISQT
jgi:glycerol uptake facilitator-like aquaporin